MSARTCSRCGAALSSEKGFTGVCPACVLNFALDPTEDVDLRSTFPGSAPDPGRGREIGPYRLLEKIGEGGMGEVWLAEQHGPVRRRVALKLVKPGLDSKQIIARFEVERQALALMDHPCVSKVFDAGTTDDGRPYFVMEYVAGAPLTEHCDRERLTTPQRLELFQQLCEGVQHAHQRGIIHRDLKPSNVLVSMQDGIAFPKIIDFGVAKAVAVPLTPKPLFTEAGVMLGTPEYMSPEQADLRAQDVDTRTDVYALGVMLYELLAGALPFEPDSLRQAGFDEVRRIIREVEPPRPSTRLGTLGGPQSAETAKNRRVDLPTLRRQLSGELDWITMKALEKARSRRYGSPAELAADLGRHLRNEPVLAGPPSASYRAKKFVRRHRFGVAAATAALLGLFAFGVAMAIQARRIAVEREAADRVSQFLANMLGSVKAADLGNALWKDLRSSVEEARKKRNMPPEQIEAVLASFDEAFVGVNPTDSALRLLDQQILARAAQTIERELAEQPRIAGRLEHVLGETYLALGLFEPAERHAMRAVELRAAAFGPEHVDTLRSQNGLARVWFEQGRYDDAERRFEETAQILREELGAEHELTLTTQALLSAVYRRNARADDARVLLDEVIATRQRTLGPEHPGTLKPMQELALLHYDMQRFEDSATLVEQVLEGLRRTLGPDHADTLGAMSLLGSSYQQLGRLPEAEATQQECLERKRQALGHEHPSTLRSMNNLANVYNDQEKYAEAEALLKETIDIRRRILRRNHPDTLSSLHNLANTYNRQGLNEEALRLYREAMEGRERELGPSHRLTLDDIYMVGAMSARLGQREEAMSWLTRAVELGYRDPVNYFAMSEDPDFKSLYADPAFQALAARAKAQDP